MSDVRNADPTLDGYPKRKRSPHLMEATLRFETTRTTDYAMGYLTTVMDQHLLTQDPKLKLAAEIEVIRVEELPDEPF